MKLTVTRGIFVYTESHSATDERNLPQPLMPRLLEWNPRAPTLTVFPPRRRPPASRRPAYQPIHSPDALSQPAPLLSGEAGGQGHWHGRRKVTQVPGTVLRPRTA